MIKQTSASVGYICNECGLPITQKVNVFTGKEEILRIKCGCRKSEMTLKLKNDAKVRLTIPCILCGANHIYNLSLNSVFSRDVFHLTCSLLNVNIALIGANPDITKHMYELCNEINDIFMMYLDNNENGDGDFFDETNEDDDDDENFDSIGEIYEELEKESYEVYKNTGEISDDTEKNIVDFKNPQYYEQVLFYVSNLVKNKRIGCGCKYPGNISVILERDRIKLQCPDCGRERYVKSSASIDVEYISGLEILPLD